MTCGQLIDRGGIFTNASYRHAATGQIRSLKYSETRFTNREALTGGYRDASRPEDIAPTIAHLLELEFPREKDSRVLHEMLRSAQTSPLTEKE